MGALSLWKTLNPCPKTLPHISSVDTSERQSLSMASYIFSRIKSNPHVSQTLISNVSSVRSVYTGRFANINLYSQISPLGDPKLSVGPVLDQWVEEGKKINITELNRIIHDLRSRNRHKHALEVSEWISSKEVYPFSSGARAVQLDLIGMVRGLESAEDYFNNLSDEDKIDKTYGAMLNCYVRERLVDKTLAHFQKMKELGFASSPLPYNGLLCLYMKTNQPEKVPDVFSEMLKSGVSPDSFSYRLCINSYGAQGDLNNMEKILKEMEGKSNIRKEWATYAMVANFFIKAGLNEKALIFLKKAETMVYKDSVGYNHLISLYTSLGSKTEMMRLWQCRKTISKKLVNPDYITMLGSLVKLGDLEEGETLFKEWESSANTYDFKVPNTLLIGFCQKGLVEKAESMLRKIVQKDKTPPPNSWSIVAAGYIEKQSMEKAFECMNEAMALLAENKGWKPKPKLVSSILSWLGDNRDDEVVDAFVSSLKEVMPVDREMYHAQIRASIRAGKEVDGILARMKADEIDEDEETSKILSLKPDKAE